MWRSASSSDQAADSGVGPLRVVDGFTRRMLAVKARGRNERSAAVDGFRVHRPMIGMRPLAPGDAKGPEDVCK